MRVFLTGATGYLGRAILERLLANGHELVAHARSAASAARLAEGAAPAIGDLSDPAWLGDQVRRADGIIHAASPNDATSRDVDTAFLDGALPALAGTDAPLVHTAGSWIHGSGTAITEESPFDPPMIVAWRPEVVQRVRAAAADGIRTTVVGPANLYGDGGGIPAMLAAGPTTGGPDPALLVVGGEQRFANVHRDDIAALYALALTAGPAGSYYLGANSESPTMTETMAVASRARGLEGRTAPESAERSRERLGPVADAVLLDTRVDCGHARVDLGWEPTGPSLLSVLAGD